MPAGPNFAAGNDSFKEYIGRSPTTVALNFKLGATLSPRLLLGGDITAIRSAASEAGTDVALQISTYNAVVTWFPVERGFFLRGGLGFANFSYDVKGPAMDASNSETGVSALVGLGYAWWLGQHFNLTANLDFSRQSYGSEEANKDRYGALPTSSGFWALGLGFDWY